MTINATGHLNKPSISAIIHGLNRHYYSLAINYRKNELEQKMLLHIGKKDWTTGLRVEYYNRLIQKQILEISRWQGLVSLKLIIFLSNSNADVTGKGKLLISETLHFERAF